MIGEILKIITISHKNVSTQAKLLRHGETTAVSFFTKIVLTLDFFIILHYNYNRLICRKG